MYRLPQADRTTRRMFCGSWAGDLSNHIQFNNAVNASIVVLLLVGVLLIGNSSSSSSGGGSGGGGSIIVVIVIIK